MALIVRFFEVVLVRLVTQVLTGHGHEQPSDVALRERENVNVSTLYANLIRPRRIYDKPWSRGNVDHRSVSLGLRITHSTSHR